MLACALFSGGVVAQTVATTPTITQQNGFVAKVPIGRLPSRKSGLRLEIDTRWLNNYGYRPVRVTVTSSAPTKANHTITIRLMSASWGNRGNNSGNGNLAVEQKIEMPSGSTAVTSVLSVPQFQLAARYWWDVWVDGKLDPDLSLIDDLAWNFAIQGTAKSSTPAFLVVGPAPQSYQLMGSVSDLYQALTLNATELPTRWIDYTCCDAISISPDDLRMLSKSRPEVLQAIGRWVRAGGQLWVNPVGRQWEELDSVEKLLRLNSPSEDAADDDVVVSHDNEKRELSDADVAVRGWQSIKFVPQKPTSGEPRFINSKTGEVRVVSDPATAARIRQDPNWQPGNEAAEGVESDETAAADNSQRDSAPWYVERPMGLGKVRVFRRPWDPIGFGLSWRMLMGFGLPGPDEEPTPITAAMETTRNWELRHGMTPDTANGDFANLLVPGVGQAPVSEFRVLITLFVVLIGPLNYWLLKRWGRLHLLVVTVPVVAALLTVSLFGYAVMSDGFGTQLRVQSLTALDQRNGEAASWARLSYYAGLAPGRGLVMPDDVALYPIIPGWSEYSDRAIMGTLRQLEWREGEARLTQGWLRSRTPTQYLAVRAHETPHRLRLQSTGERMFGTNELGTDIKYVVAVDGKGNVFTGKNLDDGVRAELKSAHAADALAPLRKLVSDNQPTVPPELADLGSIFSTTRRRRQAYVARAGFEAGDAVLSGNLLGETVAALVNPSSDTPLTLAPNTFAAITTTNPEVATGVSEVVEHASFHVIVGTW